MSRFAEPWQAYLGGASLGTQQFSLLASLAAQEAQRKMASQQFDQRHLLDLARFNLDKDETLQRLGYAASDQSMQEQQFNHDRSIWEQEQQSLDGLRGWVREKILATSPAGGMAPDPYSAPSMGGSQSPGITLPQMPGDPMAAPPNRAQAALLRMVDHADGQGIRAILPYIEQSDKQQELERMMRAIDKEIGSPSILADPDQRALYSAFRAGEDPDSMLRVAMGEVNARRSLRQLTEAGNSIGIPGSLAQVLGPSGLSDIATTQVKAKMGAPRADPLADNRLTMAGQVYAQQADALEKSKKPEDRARAAEFRAAQMAVAQGHTLPDGSAVLNAGQPGRDGFVRIMAPDGRVSGITPQAFAGIQQSGVQAQQQQKQSGKQALLAAFQQATGRAPRPGSQEDLQILRQIEAQMRGAR